MPDELAEPLVALVQRGGDLERLKELAITDASRLTASLKQLGLSKVGERARVVCALKELTTSSAPSATTSSQQQLPVAAAAARADVALVKHGTVCDMFGDGGLLKTTLRTGDETLGNPPALSSCKIRYTALVLPECRRFEAKVMQFQLGEREVPRGLDKCVSTMCKGEECELICRAEYAYGDAGKPPEVPPGSSVRFDVELISWVAPKLERSELTAEARLERAVRLKADGGAAFSSGLWLDAQVAYHEAATLLVDEIGDLSAPLSREREARALLVKLHLNAAACALKREEWFAAEKACGAALARLIDPLGEDKATHAKALFRRAKARLGASDYGGARADAKAAHALEPASREVRDLWGSIRERESASTASEAEVYSRMTTRLVYREINVARRPRSRNPRVFFDVAVGGRPLPHRIVFALFPEHAPLAAENFRRLCTGEQGATPSGTRLHYKGTHFHRAVNVDDLPPEFLNESLDPTAPGRSFEVWKGLLVQGGDIVHGDGTGGASAIHPDGAPIADEANDLRFHEPGLLATAGRAPPMREQAAEEATFQPDSTTSQFFITTKERNQSQGGCTILHFNGRHTIFGRVVEGMQSVHAINRCRSDPARLHALLDEVEITGCGQLKTEEEEEREREEAALEQPLPPPPTPPPPTEPVHNSSPPPDVTDETWPAALDGPVAGAAMPTAADLAVQSAEIDEDD